VLLLTFSVCALDCNRQMVVRGVVDTLQQVLESRHEVERVFAGIVKLCNDSGNLFSLFLEA